MPLLDHFHPPLHGPRRWEGFHHAWATVLAQQLNNGILPPDHFAEPEISLGPELEIDVATLKLTPAVSGSAATASGSALPPRDARPAGAAGAAARPAPPAKSVVGRIVNRIPTGFLAVLCAALLAAVAFALVWLRERRPPSHRSIDGAAGDPGRP